MDIEKDIRQLYPFSPQLLGLTSQVVINLIDDLELDCKDEQSAVGHLGFALLCLMPERQDAIDLINRIYDYADNQHLLQNQFDWWRQQDSDYEWIAEQMGRDS